MLSSASRGQWLTKSVSHRVQSAVERGVPILGEGARAGFSPVASVRS